MSELPAWRPERYRALLHLLVRQMQLDPRLRRRFDSCDLVQDVLAKAVEQLPQFRGRSEGEFVRWLHQVFATVAVDKVRRERAHKRDPALEQSIHAAAAASSARWDGGPADRRGLPSQQAEHGELRSRLAEAIQQLPDDQRDVVLCRDVMAMSVAEIAGQMGRSERSVAGLLLRGRRRLRELLPEYQ